MKIAWSTSCDNFKLRDYKRILAFCHSDGRALNQNFDHLDYSLTKWNCSFFLKCDWTVSALQREVDGSVFDDTPLVV